MASVNVTQLRRYLPDYLRQVQQGEEIAITLHGRTISRIVPEHRENRQDAALKRLQALRDTVIAGDILASLDEDGSSDADHL